MTGRNCPLDDHVRILTSEVRGAQQCYMCCYSSVKEVMYSPVSVCLFLCLLTGLLKN